MDDIKQHIKLIDHTLYAVLGIALTAAVVGLGAVVMQEKRQEFSDTVRTFEIVWAGKSGKSGKVVLRNTETNQVTDKLSIGSCSTDRVNRIKIGSKWDVHEVVYVYPESKRYVTDYAGLRAICPK